MNHNLQIIEKKIDGYTAYFFKYDATPDMGFNVSLLSEVGQPFIPGFERLIKRRKLDLVTVEVSISPWLITVPRREAVARRRNKMKDTAPLRVTRNKLWKVIADLESKYDKEYRLPLRLEYAQTEVINVLLNYLKSLEYHYRDDVRVKNNKEYNAATRLFKKIGEQVDPKDSYSQYRLKTEPKK